MEIALLFKRILWKAQPILTANSPSIHMNIPSAGEARIRFFDSIYRPNVKRANPQKPFDNLDGGTRVLSNETECNQYMALYCGHHFYKLYSAYSSTRFENIEGRNVEIVDWGCGQALATCILIDYLINIGIKLNVSSITLIEPSAIALQCGCNYVRQMFQNDAAVDSAIRKVSKYIDELSVTDLISDSGNIKIHLFSNIIDVEGFDLSQLHQLMISSFQGTNRLICTSPDNLRKQRLDAFYHLFLQSHQLASESNSSEEIYGEIFYVANRRFEQRGIGRYERQFTVNLTQG